MPSQRCKLRQVPPGTLIAALLAVVAPAQQSVQLPLSAVSAPYTLHVYQNLVQVPSMVLNPLMGSTKGLQAKDFKLRLDSGPVFHPLHVRVEGNDPLSVTLLLEDPVDSEVDLAQELVAYGPALPSDLFLPADRLSIATARCNQITSLRPRPASTTTIVSGVGSVLQSRPQNLSHCEAPTPLWDVIGTLAMRLQDQGGRRVLVVVSDGVDEGSRYSWDDVRKLAVRTGVTIFGVRLRSTAAAQYRMYREGLGLRAAEDPFSMLCTGSGGIVLDADGETTWPQVHRILTLLRERYILDFQRPVNSTSGMHRIDLSVKDKKAIVRVSGTTVPLPDPKTAADPSTVPSDTSKAPVMGTRRILPPTH